MSNQLYLVHKAELEYPQDLNAGVVPDDQRAGADHFPGILTGLLHGFPVVVPVHAFIINEPCMVELSISTQISCSIVKLVDCH